MKRSHAIIATVTVALTVSAAFAWYVLSQESEFSAPRPSTAAHTPPPIPAELSRLVLPVNLPISTVESLANSSFSSTFSGSKKSGSLRLRWSGNRSKIFIKGSGDFISIATKISGTVTAEPTSAVLKAVKNVLGLVTCLNPGKRLAKTQLEVSVSAKIMPRVSSDWHLGPSDIVVNENLRAARLRILCWPSFSIRSRLKPEVDDWVSKGVRTLRRQIAKDKTIRNASQKAWKSLCGSFPLNRGAFWLESRPVAIATAHPKVQGEVIRLQLGLDAWTRVTNNSTRPKCDFPGKLSIKPLQAGLFRLALSGKFKFSQLELILRKQVVGKTTSGSVKIKINDVKLHSYGRSILVETAVEARTSGWPFARATGTIYLVAEPKLIVKKQVLTFDRIRLDVESAEILTEVVGEAAEPLLLAVLRAYSKIDMRELVTKRLLPRANQAFAALPKKDFRLQGGVRSIEATHLAVGSDYLQLSARADGTVAMDVKNLKIRGLKQ